MTDEIREPSIEKPVIKHMVEGANGQTIFNDYGDPNSKHDPYAHSRDIVYSMKYILMQALNDMIIENNSPNVDDVVGKLGFTNHRLLEGYNSLVDTINSFVGSKRARVDLTIDEAATGNGYAQLEPELKLILESEIGRLFIAMFFFAARSLTPQGGKPLGDIGYNGAFDFIASEVKQALDGVETPYAKGLKEKRDGKEVIGANKQQE